MSDVPKNVEKTGSVPGKARMDAQRMAAKNTYARPRIPAGIPKHEERRILLLIQYATQWGAAAEPLAVILAMVAEQMQPTA